MRFRRSEATTKAVETKSKNRMNTFRRAVWQTGEVKQNNSATNILCAPSNVLMATQPQSNNAIVFKTNPTPIIYNHFYCISFSENSFA